MIGLEKKLPMGYDRHTLEILRKMGYFSYQQGLIYRHLNQQGGWKSHLENSRRAILDRAAELKPSRITVLGSGWLLDVPLVELAESYSEIVLVDIVHPPEVKKQVKEFSNVRLSDEDISGGLPAAVFRFCSSSNFIKRKRSLEGLIVPEYRFKEEPGFVVSLNLLSQLDILPLMHIENKCRIGNDEKESFRREVQEKHLQLLKQYNSLLITDYEEHFTFEDGKEETEKTVVAELPSGKTRKDWTWDFDLKGSDYYRKRSVNRVAAITF